MSRRIFMSLGLAFGLLIAGAAGAHHPPGMEGCKSITLTGQVERIEWHNPHVELTIRTDDGMSHHLTWLNVNQLGWAGIHKDTLRVGDQVVVTAGTREEIVDRPLLLSEIHRASDGWEWSQVPQGC